MKLSIGASMALVIPLALVSLSACTPNSHDANHGHSADKHSTDKHNADKSAAQKSVAGQTPQAPEPLVIALDWTPNTNHTGLFVAKELGFFDEAGFAPDIVQPAEDSAATLVAHKRADLGVYFQPNMIKRLQKGEPIVAVAAILQENTAGILAKGKVDDLKQLRGKKYSTWEDPIDDATVASLVGESQKIAGEALDASAGLALGVFDFILVYKGWDYIHAKIKGVPSTFFALKDYNSAFNYYSPVLIARTDADKIKISRALGAIAKGYIYASHNPEKSAQILLKYAPEADATLVHQSQAMLSPLYLQDGKFGRFDQTRWDAFYQWVGEQKLIERPFVKGEGMSNDYLPD